MNQMCWMSQFGAEGKKILHLQIGDRWLPYTSVPQHSVPDHQVSNGSLGFATMQHLLQQGWKIVPAPMEEN